MKYITKKEQQFLDILRMGGRLKTADIVQRVGVCKVTALKYLNNLKESGLVDYELIGPTKLWYVVGGNGDGPRGRGPLYKTVSEISELLKRLELLAGKQAIVIMTGDGLVGVFNQEKSGKCS